MIKNSPFTDVTIPDQVLFQIEKYADMCIRCSDRLALSAPRGKSERKTSRAPLTRNKPDHGEAWHSRSVEVTSQLPIAGYRESFGDAEEIGGMSRVGENSAATMQDRWHLHRHGLCTERRKEREAKQKNLKETVSGFS